MAITIRAAAAVGSAAMRTQTSARPFVAVALTLLALTVGACADDGPRATSSERTAVTDPPTTAEATTTDPATTAPDATDAPATTDPPAQAGAIDWQPFGSGGVEVGSLQVPVDYDDPDGPTFDLYLARHLATDPAKRIGTLLVNPGGPGFGGSDFAVYAAQIYSDTLLEHFDILGWDPRGTGLSEPAIDCVDDYDRYFADLDMTPDDDAERQRLVDLAAEFTDACAANNAEILPFIGTNNSARDMDSIRRALGEETITYFGFSYGSELGATWATLFPDTVRAAVLDGAADPTVDDVTSSLQQIAGFEQSLATFLARCSERASCEFHNGGDAAGAYDALMEELDANPVPADPDRPLVGRAVALNATAQAMYSEALWPMLESALAQAQAGDGSGLLELHDMYFQRQPDGSYDNSLEAFQAISCMDSDERRTVQEEDALAPRFYEVAPRFAPEGSAGSYFCTFFPPSEEPRAEVTGAGAGPILVVGTTGDPATPLSSTEAMARALEQGVLLVVVADQHTGYGVNQCSYDVIDSYLVDLTVPADGTRCE